MSNEETSLSLSGLAKKFSNTERPALSDIDVNLTSRKINAIVGPNGAGKTTLFKIIAGLTLPDVGEVKFFRNGKREDRPSVSLLLDGTRGYYPNLTVIENFRYLLALESVGNKTPEHELDNWLDRFNLANKKHSICQTLSRGMLQRLGIMVAVASGSEILLLDEPTTGLDIAESISFFKLVRESCLDAGKLVIFSSHQPETILGLANHVTFLMNGKVRGQLDLFDAAFNQEKFVDKYLELTSS